MSQQQNALRGGMIRVCATNAMAKFNANVNVSCAEKLPA
ncbi:hypothetical protein B194_0189 [Serratia plymuthica A30]|nr:hypothetical protein B194_0189 [Serratia plymuthica A30]